MTSEILHYRARDAFVKNDVFHLRRDGNCPEINVAAVGWLCCANDVRSAHIFCGSHALTEICTNFEKLEPWLLSCHSVWQVDNTINRRCKLWMSLKRRGIKHPKGRFIDEQVLVSSHGIKWFSAVNFSVSEYSTVMQIVHEEPNSLVAVIPKDSGQLIDSIVQATWKSSEIGPSFDVLSLVVEGGGLLMWPLGDFDDPEAGVAVFGNPVDIDLIV